MDRLFRKDTGFGQIIDEAVRTRPEHTAIVADDIRLTYAELGEKVDRLAAALERDGVQMGEPVAVISRNCAEFLIIELALYRLGAVSVKINWRYSPEEIQYLLELNEVHLAFVRYERWDWAKQVVEANRERNIRFISLNPDEQGSSPFERYLENAPEANAFRPRKIDLQQPLLRIHTSGTTGKPKCVVHTHQDFLAEIRSCLQALGFHSGWVYQLISQLFHVSCIGAYMMLSVGGTLVVMSRFEPKEYLKSLERERVTGIGVLPVVLKRILDYPELDRFDISSLKRINYSTCPMPPALLAQAMEKLGDSCEFCQSYGMTEMSSVVTVLSPEDHRRGGGTHLGSVGRAIPGAEVKILREDGTEAAPMEEGEILLKGPGQMRGYYHVDVGVNETALKDGWYHSKDMGWLDSEGYLYVCGRKDDLIISGGENIYPKEIVDVLMRLTDDVMEAAVYGVPDPVWGEHVKASVVMKPGSRLTVHDLKAYCRENVAHYKAPKEIEILKELPKNATGKVIIRALIEKNCG